mgnify:CR=1 FL=1
MTLQVVAALGHQPQVEERLGHARAVGTVPLLQGEGLPIVGCSRLEVVPILDFIPDTEFEVNAGIGARYYFGG